MNTKTAKRLRREARYHPSMPRKYMLEITPKMEILKNGQVIKVEKRTRVLADDDPRVLYNELKKEYYAGA